MPETSTAATSAAAAPLRYSYLGPSGTFTEMALQQLIGDEPAVLLPQADVVSALEAVRTGEADRAVVAIESTVQGGVTATLDALAVGDPLVLLREALIPVAFTLAAAGPVDLSAIRRVAAHPHAWVQCSRWLRSNIPGVLHVPATSNTAPAALLATGVDPATVGFDAALVPPPAVARYGLTAIADAVADNPDAVTRFVMVGHVGDVPPPTGADKTTLVVHLPDNESGALLTMLEQFSTRSINLSRIESRPIGDALGRYSFSIDAEGHIAEERMGEALMGLHRVCPHVRFLGSYPRADDVAQQVRPGTTDREYREAKAWLAQVRNGQTI